MLKTLTRQIGFLGAAVVLLSCQPGPPYFIPGSATLPACDQAAAFDLEGTWFDSGVVTVESEGCDGAPAGATFDVCPLNWEFEPALDENGAPIVGDYTVLVDNEYIIEARLCDATLYLEGGWWLPVEDEGQCTYEDDSAEEVGIQMGGSSLAVSDPDQEPLLVAEGTLEVQGACAGSVAIRLRQFDMIVTPPE
ncbi:MAG: hypothetical protein AAF500_10290 [Myxococcota bacterium]